MEFREAQFLSASTIVDPDSNGEVEVEYYRDPVTLATFGIDTAFMDQVVDQHGIPSPYEDGVRLTFPDVDESDEPFVEQAVTEMTQATDLNTEVILSSVGASLRVFKDPVSSSMFAVDLSRVAKDRIRSPFNEWQCLTIKAGPVQDRKYQAQKGVGHGL